MSENIIFICDLCDKEAVEVDSWFLSNRCEDHKHISPVDGQKLPNYKPRRTRIKKKL